jgi:hypothetical protein
MQHRACTVRAQPQGWGVYDYETVEFGSDLCLALSGVFSSDFVR